MHELHDIGLYLNDLNKFDGSAEMLVTELQHNDQLQKAFDAVSNFLSNNIDNDNVIFENIKATSIF